MKAVLDSRGHVVPFMPGKDYIFFTTLQAPGMGLCLLYTLELPKAGSRTHPLSPSVAQGLLSRCSCDLTKVCPLGLLFAFLKWGILWGCFGS